MQFLQDGKVYYRFCETVVQVTPGSPSYPYRHEKEQINKANCRQKKGMKQRLDMKCDYCVIDDANVHCERMT